MKNFVVTLLLFTSFRIFAQCPAITVQPVGGTYCGGEAISMSVQVTGSNLVYQWYRDGMPIVTATSATYTIPISWTTDSGNYTCRITAPDCGTVESSIAQLNVAEPPQFTMMPVSEMLCEGMEAQFSVTTSGSNISYEWYFNDVAIPDSNSNVLVVDSVTASDAGHYSCVISSPSCPPAHSIPAQLLVNAPPVVISTLPAQLTVCSGQTASLCVDATGDELTYQWHVETNIIAGATTPYFTVGPDEVTDVESYYCIVSNNCGSVMTNVTTVANCMGTTSFQERTLQLSPNPAHGTLQISSLSDWNPAEISIFDMLGRSARVIWLERDGNNGKIDVGSFAPGIYILTTDIGSGKISKRFIVE